MATTTKPAKSKLKAQTAEIENVGPIDHLNLPVKPGAITVLRGRNGSGKTQALAAVDAAVTGRTKITSRDNTVGGSIEYGGVRVKVARGGSNRRTELDPGLHVESLEDTLSIADLVDPHVKDPDAADARRIKAIVALSGARADWERFATVLTTDELKSIITPETRELTDFVQMAATIKRDIEAAARKAEAAVEDAERDIDTLKRQNEGINTAAPHDADTLTEAHETAIATRAKLQERRTQAITLHATAKQSRERLAAAREQYAGPTVADATVKVEEAVEEVITQERIVERCKAALREAEHDLQNATNTKAAAEGVLAAARNHERLTAGWEADVSAAEAATVPDVEELEAAQQAIDQAKAAVDLGAKVREALKRGERIETATEALKSDRRHAERLRDAARSAEDVLSNVVQEMGGAFRVNREMRLVVDHPKRGETYYAELSHGERWRYALRVAIDTFRKLEKSGLIVIPQEAWEGLDGATRLEIQDEIRGSDLAILTAEADRSETPSDHVTAEVLN